ncbi:MAG TPA: extracellular solute-binding protein [Chloroflexota bacterium]
MALTLSRRRFLLAALGTAAVPVLQACGQSQPAQPAQSAAQPQGDGKVLFWNNSDQWKKTNDFYTQQFDAFKKAHPNASFQAASIPYADYEAKYLAAFAARKNAPELFVAKVAQFAGSVAVGDAAPDDLNTLLDKNVVKAISNFYKIDNRFYGVPLSADLGMMLYYNSDHFKEAGLDPSKPPETMTQMAEYAKKLVKVEGGDIKRSGFAHRYSGAPSGIADKFLPFLHAFGGRAYAADRKTSTGLVNGPESIAALQFVSDMTQKDKTSSLALGLPEEQFGRGQASMIFRESWLVGWLRDNAPNIHYEVVPMPSEKQYPGVSLFFSWAVMVNKFSPNKDLAWEFLKFLAKPETDLALAKLEGYLPVWESNFKDPYLADRKDYKALQKIMSSPPGPYYDHPYINDISTRLGQAVEQGLRGTKSAKDALDAAAKDIDAILAKA